MKIPGLALPALLMLAGSCATEQAYQQAPAPPPGHGLVYIYRIDTWPVSRMDAHFTIKGTRIAALWANTYTWIHLPEGSYVLEQVWDTRHAPPAHRREFSAAHGSARYLRLNVEQGTLQMKWNVVEVPAAEAAAQIAKLSYRPAPAAPH